MGAATLRSTADACAITRSRRDRLGLRRCRSPGRRAPANPGDRPWTIRGNDGPSSSLTSQGRNRNRTFLLGRKADISIWALHRSTRALTARGVSWSAPAWAVCPFCRWRPACSVKRPERTHRLLSYLHTVWLYLRLLPPQVSRIAN